MMRVVSCLVWDGTHRCLDGDLEWLGWAIVFCEFTKLSLLGLVDYQYMLSFVNGTAFYDWWSDSLPVTSNERQVGRASNNSLGTGTQF